MLGALKARSVIHLLLQLDKNYSECCYFPALVEALGDCGQLADVPLLISLFDRESEANGGIVHRTLQKLTDRKLPADAPESKTSWQAWWRKSALATRPAG